MAAYFIDLDGTLFQFGTNELLPGALEELNRLKDNGDIIVLTTRRGDLEFEGHEIFGEHNTLCALEKLKIPYSQILFNLPSPRVVVNDSGAYAINVKPDSRIRIGHFEEWSIH